MTVIELIAKLSQVDPHLKVLYCGDEGNYWEVQDVVIEPQWNDSNRNHTKMEVAAILS